MTKMQKIRSVITAIASLICAMVMILYPRLGIDLVLIVMILSLTTSGIYTLGYYFTMARYMVDGQLVLIKGIVVLNLGLLMISLSNAPLQYVMIYLLICHGFSGLTEILHALDIRSMQIAAWKRDFAVGAVNLVLCVICAIFINSANTMVYIYSLTLIHSALSKIINATKKTALVYIQ